MYKSRENQHMRDILFVLSLFCVFAVSSVVIILFGAHIYRSTVSQMDDNYTARTSIAYITEKIRQADEQNAIEIRNEGGHQILMMTTIIDGTTYATSLYEYNGWLCELFARTDIDLPLDAGQPIMEIQQLAFSQISPRLLSVSFVDGTGDSTSLYVSTHCTTEVSHE